MGSQEQEGNNAQFNQSHYITARVVTKTVSEVLRILVMGTEDFIILVENYKEESQH